MIQNQEWIANNFHVKRKEAGPEGHVWRNFFKILRRGLTLQSPSCNGNLCILDHLISLNEDWILSRQSAFTNSYSQGKHIKALCP